VSESIAAFYAELGQSVSWPVGYGSGYLTGSLASKVLIVTFSEFGPHDPADAYNAGEAGTDHAPVRRCSSSAARCRAGPQFGAYPELDNRGRTTRTTSADARLRDGLRHRAHARLNVPASEIGPARGRFPGQPGSGRRRNTYTASRPSVPAGVGGLGGKSGFSGRPPRPAVAMRSTHTRDPRQNARSREASYAFRLRPGGEGSVRGVTERRGRRRSPAHAVEDAHPTTPMPCACPRGSCRAAGYLTVVCQHLPGDVQLARRSRQVDDRAGLPAAVIGRRPYRGGETSGPGSQTRSRPTSVAGCRCRRPRRGRLRQVLALAGAAEGARRVRTHGWCTGREEIEVVLLRRLHVPVTAPVQQLYGVRRRATDVLHSL